MLGGLEFLLIEKGAKNKQKKPALQEKWGEKTPRQDSTPALEHHHPNMSPNYRCSYGVGSRNGMPTAPWAAFLLRKLGVDFGVYG